MTVKADIVKEYIGKYPKCKNAQLARIIYKKNKKVWGNEESVRSLIRRHKGQCGEQRISDKTFYSPAGSPANYDKLPEPLKSFKDWKDYQIDGENILGLFDVHIPYYDKPAIITTIEYAKKRPIDTILLGGDFMDFYDVSFWSRDPNARSLLGEIRDGLKFISFLRETWPKAGIVYKVGNHEERLERYVHTKAPELIESENETGDFADVEIVSNFENIIKQGKLGVNIVNDKRIVKVGKYLNIIHGSEFGGMAVPVNPARSLYQKGKEIALCGHYHQTSNHNEKSLSGQIIACWSVGCLCDLHPKYAPINKWNSGFCIIDRNGDAFEVENKRIINGKIY